MKPAKENLSLSPIHNERKHCRLENGFGTHLLEATLLASLGQNHATEIDVNAKLEFPKYTEVNFKYLELTNWIKQWNMRHSQFKDFIITYVLVIEL